MTRDQQLEIRRRMQAEAIKRELMKAQNRRVRECLQRWADMTPERKYQ